MLKFKNKLPDYSFRVYGKSRIDMPDFLLNHLDKSPINAFPIHEYWLDIGHLKDYDRANEDIKTLNT